MLKVKVLAAGAVRSVLARNSDALPLTMTGQSQQTIDPLPLAEDRT